MTWLTWDPPLLCHHERRTLGSVDDVIGKVSSTYTPTLPLQEGMGTLLTELMSLDMAERSDASLWPTCASQDARGLVDQGSLLGAEAHPWVPSPRTHRTGPTFL